MKRYWKTAVVVAGAALAAAWMMGGPTSPPPGPVSSQYKTLTEVEPRTAINAANTPGDADSLFKITQPGSYYLTGNITGVVGKHGVEIAASGVTLDLNGFDLLGVAGSLDGVSTTVAGLTDIAVVNGSVRSWGDKGIDMLVFGAINCRLADLLASGNASTGINANVGCTVSNCSVFDNTNNGIVAGNGCTVSDCSAYQNAGNGISTGFGCTVRNCSAYDNTAKGINVTSGCMVADCAAGTNTLDGIVCSTGCVIRGNTCWGNGSGGGDGAGIHATFKDNRIEGNNCTSADRGIDVDFDGNIIIKNTCSGNTTNWDIVANNVFGPIIDRTAPASAAVLGNSAASSIGSTDPWANFSY